MSAKLTEPEVQEAKRELREKAHLFAEKAYSFFEANKWTWSLRNGSEVPTIDDIFFLTLSLIGELKHGNEMFAVSSGRVRVAISKYHEHGEITGTISLVPIEVFSYSKTE